MLQKSFHEALASRQRYVTKSGHGAWVTSYFGVEAALDKTIPPPPIGTLHAMAFSVEEDPESTLDAHFHAASQFQVFYEGSGAMGRTPLDGLRVHYASAYTPYGPILAGQAGIKYLTLRNGWDPGPRFVQQHVEEARQHKDAWHQWTTDALSLLSADQLQQLGDESRLPVVTSDANGAAAWLYRLPPRRKVTGPNPRSSGGQYWVVIGGSIAGETPLPRLSCLFVAPTDDPLDATAGTDGLELLYLQFPRLPA
jgi:hypothetical protein